MLIRRSKIGVADNSMIKTIRLYHIYNKASIAKVGDICLGSIVHRKKGSKYKKGEVVRVLITNTKARYQRPDGSFVSYSHNLGVIISKTNKLIGTRIISPIMREFNKSNLFNDLNKRVSKFI